MNQHRQNHPPQKTATDSRPPLPPLQNKPTQGCLIDYNFHYVLDTKI